MYDLSQVVLRDIGISMFPSLAMSRLSSRRDGELANMRYQAKNEPKPR